MFLPPRSSQVSIRATAAALARARYNNAYLRCATLCRLCLYFVCTATHLFSSQNVFEIVNVPHSQGPIMHTRLFGAL